MQTATFQDLLAAGWTQREAALLIRYRNAYALASSREIARQRIDLDHAEASRWCWVRWLIQRGKLRDQAPSFAHQREMNHG